jgi:hypothetical protein
VLLAALLVTAAIAHLMQVFTLGAADVAVRASGFPKHMFVLPVATRSLVGWPILCAAAIHGGLWLVVATLVLRPAGYAAPVLWPATIIAAGTAWVQALGWTPFPTPYARIPALALAITPLVLLAAAASITLESRMLSLAVIAGSLAWMAVAYLVAVHGVSRARTGHDGDWKLTRQFAAAISIRRQKRSTTLRPPFRTAARAQLWHEWRRNASFLPTVMGLLTVLFLAASCQAIVNPNSGRILMFGNFRISPAAMSLLAWIAVLLMLATTLGQSAGKFDLWGKEEIPSFFAIRPLTTNQLVLIKFLAAGLSTLATCGLFLVFVALWALVDVSPLNARESLMRSLAHHLSPNYVAIAIALFIGLAAVTWRSMATGLWLGLVGRKWVSVVMAAVVTAVMTVAVISGSWIYRSPEVQAQLMRLLPWLLGVLIVLKGTAAAWTAFALWKLHLASHRGLAMMFGAWLATAFVVFVTLHYFVPFSWLLVLGVTLFVPFTRLAVAPLALRWNRHR